MLSGVNDRAIASLLINARGSAPLQMITSAQLIQSAWMTACIKAQICRALGMLARCHLMTLSGAVSSKAHSIRAGNAAPSGEKTSNDTGSILHSLTCVSQLALAALIWQQSWQAERSHERLQQCLHRGSSCPLQNAAGQSDWQAALCAGPGPSSLASTAPQCSPGAGSQPLPAAVSTTHLTIA